MSSGAYQARARGTAPRQAGKSPCPWGTARGEAQAGPQPSALSEEPFYLSIPAVAPLGSTHSSDAGAGPVEKPLLLHFPHPTSRCGCHRARKEHFKAEIFWSFFCLLLPAYSENPLLG